MMLQYLSLSPLSNPPTTYAPQGATGETWHYFKCNFASTKAAAAVRRGAHRILFINKFIHKWWDLSRVCERGAGGGERWRWETASADGCREGFCLFFFLPLHGGGGTEHCICGSSRTSQCGCLKWADQSWRCIRFCCTQLTDSTHTHTQRRGFPGWVGFLSAWTIEAFTATAAERGTNILFRESGWIYLCVSSSF